MTTIEWTEATWNPTTGCDRVSLGCDNCYALTMAARLKAMGSLKYQTDGDPRTSGPGFGLAVHEDVLDLPRRWRTPRRVFVNSMSDLFHPRVDTEFIARVFAVMAATPHHTYQVLTKRAPRMRAIVGGLDGSPHRLFEATTDNETASALYTADWPLPNVWLGVSVEDQAHADQRIPALLDTPAAVRWLSCEPLLGPVDVVGSGTAPRYWLTGRPYWGPEHQSPTGVQLRELIVAPQIDWVVVGGESGPGARPMHPDWARSLRDQCAVTGTPFFFKQWGGRTPKAGGRRLDGRVWDEYPTAVTP